MSRVLPVALAACALAAAFAAAGFVTLPHSGSRVPQPQPHGLAKDVAPLEEFAPSYAEPAAEQGPSALKWLGAGLLGGLIIAVSSAPVSAEEMLYAFKPGPIKPDLSSLTIKNAKQLELCKDNKKYKKKAKDRMFKMVGRQKKYPQGTAVHERYNIRIAAENRRVEAYGERLCRKDAGIPIAVASGEVNVRGSVIPASLVFLYVAGWIGWAGRSYLQRTNDKQKEIMIDVPLALTCMASGFAFPVAAWQEIVNGEMTESDENIYRSGAEFWAGGRRG
jgi:hypothetical protein